MTAVVCAAAVFMTGCDKELPTIERMTTISTAIGKTAGYACELSKTKTSVKEAIFSVIDTASKVVPQTNETFTVAWTPVINEELDKLIKKGKISESELPVIKIALAAATEGIDYVFVKYPKAKEVKELVSAATTGFISGYKSVVAFAAGAEEINDEAYKYIKSKLDAMK